MNSTAIWLKEMFNLTEVEMKDKLKPCPFCGGEASIGKVKYAFDSETAKLNSRNIGYFPACTQCSAQLMFSICFVTQKEAIKAWNWRSK